MVLQHDAADFVQFSFERASDGAVVHGLAHQHRADAAAGLRQHHDHFTERQHADQVPVFHDDQRADVFLGHHVDGLGQWHIGRDGEQGVALDAQDVADFHGVLLVGCDRFCTLAHLLCCCVQTLIHCLSIKVRSLSHGVMAMPDFEYSPQSSRLHDPYVITGSRLVLLTFSRFCHLL